MIHKKYMRTMWGGLIFALVSSIVVGIFVLIHWQWLDFVESVVMWNIYITVGSIGGGGILVAIIGFIFAKLTRPHDQGPANIDYEKIKEVIPQLDVWFFKRVMLFNTEGAYIGRSTMEITGVRTFLISLLSNINLLTPLNYHFHDHQGNHIVTFKRRGWRSAIVDIWDATGRQIGHVEFDELKVLLRFRGYAFVGTGETIEKFRVKSELLFDETDGSGLLDLSSFRNDVNYHYIFRDFQVRVVKFGYPPSEDKGKVALALLLMLNYLSWK